MESIPPILAWLPVLARSEETDYGKLIFFGIMVVIWIVSAIAKSVGKSKSQQTWTGDEWPDTHSDEPSTDQWTAEQWTPEQSTGQHPAPPAVPPRPPPAHSQQPVSRPAEWASQVPPQVPVPVPPRLAAPPRRPAPPAYRPPPVPQAKRATAAAPATARGPSKIEAQERLVYEMPPEQRGRQSGTRDVAAPGAGGRALNVKEMRRWMTPEVMHRQYILTELFDPPPSDRSDGRPST